MTRKAPIPSPVFDSARDFVRHHDSDHSREHRNLQMVKPVLQMARLNQCRLDKILCAYSSHTQVVKANETNLSA